MISTIDVYFIIPLFAGLYFGWKRGVYVNLISLGILLPMIYLFTLAARSWSFFFYEKLGTTILTTQANIFAFLLFIFVIINHFPIRYMEEKYKHKKHIAHLSTSTRVLGLFIGGLRYLFILSALFAVFEFHSRNKTWLENSNAEKSILYKTVSQTSPFIYPFLEFTNVPR